MIRRPQRVALCALALSACSAPAGRPIPEVVPRQCATESVTAHPIQRSFWVAPGGDDAGPGSETAPYRTLARAQQAIRGLNRAMSGDLVVRIAPGDYPLDAPLTLSTEDSGSNGYKVVYEAERGPGTVRLIGGQRIRGWRPYAGAILAAPVTPGLVFHTLYENGVRADEARFPHRANAPSLPMSRAGYLVSAGVAGSSTVVQYNPGELPPLTGDLSALKLLIWPFDGRAWYTDIVPVAALDPAARLITLAHPTRYEIGAGARYFLEGALALLGAPGEFFLDSPAGTLYYWPRSGDVAASEIIAPTLKTLVSIRGASPAAPVHDLQLRGLGFEASDFTDWYRFGWPEAGQSGEGHAAPAFDRQLEMAENRVGLITMANTEQVDLFFSHVKGSGHAGVYLLFANRYDCIYGNLVEHTGIDGLMLQGGYPGEGDVLRDNVLSNNVIHHVGELAGNAAGIDLSNCGGNEISYSVIHDSPRYGIVIHADSDTSGDLLYAQNNLVQYVDIEDVCQDSGDTAALYTFGLSRDGTSPRQNTFRQIVIRGAIADPSMRDVPPFGLYTDNDSSVQLFEDIRIDDTAGAPYFSNTTRPQSFTNVSWEPSWDESRLERSRIGVTADFPPAYAGR